MDYDPSQYPQHGFTISKKQTATPATSTTPSSQLRSASNQYFQRICALDYEMSFAKCCTKVEAQEFTLTGDSLNSQTDR